ncbi:GNAT family N-acetyltransferase [Reinekea blandensis]|nr:GNAT family protein [Reinekea blandensis]
MTKNHAPTLCKLSTTDYPALFDFEQSNKNWFEQWVPPRPDSYQHYDSFCTQCDRLRAEMRDGRAGYFLGYLGDSLVGRFNLTTLQEGTADVGYRIGQAFTGRGLAFPFASLLVDEARTLGLKTLTASALKENIASSKTLQRLGFVQQNTVPEIVHINKKAMTLLAYQRSL